MDNKKTFALESTLRQIAADFVNGARIAPGPAGLLSHMRGAGTLTTAAEPRNSAITLEEIERQIAEMPCDNLNGARKVICSSDVLRKFLVAARDDRSFQMIDPPDEYLIFGIRFTSDPVLPPGYAIGVRPATEAEKANPRVAKIGSDVIVLFCGPEKKE